MQYCRLQWVRNEGNDAFPVFFGSNDVSRGGASVFCFGLGKNCDKLNGSKTTRFNLLLYDSHYWTIQENNGRNDLLLRKMHLEYISVKYILNNQGLKDAIWASIGVQPRRQQTKTYDGVLYEGAQGTNRRRPSLVLEGLRPKTATAILVRKAGVMPPSATVALSHTSMALSGSTHRFISLENESLLFSTQRCSRGSLTASTQDVKKKSPDV